MVAEGLGVEMLVVTPLHGPGSPTDSVTGIWEFLKAGGPVLGSLYNRSYYSASISGAPDFGKLPSGTNSKRPSHLELGSFGTCSLFC